MVEFQTKKKVNENTTELKIARETIGRTIKIKKILQKQNCRFEFL